MNTGPARCQPFPSNKRLLCFTKILELHHPLRSGRGAMKMASMVSCLKSYWHLAYTLAFTHIHKGSHFKRETIDQILLFQIADCVHHICRSWMFSHWSFRLMTMLPGTQLDLTALNHNRNDSVMTTFGHPWVNIRLEIFGGQIHELWLM